MRVIILESHDSFSFHVGGKYYYTTNNSTLVAFIVGGKFKAGNGFKVIGGHTGMCNASTT